ncbi:cell division protein FtsW, partial [Streptomyces sp. WZ.A104]
MPADERSAVRRMRTRASVPRPLAVALPLPPGLALRGRLATGARRPETARGSARGGSGPRTP